MYGLGGDDRIAAIPPESDPRRGRQSGSHNASRLRSRESTRLGPYRCGIPALLTYCICSVDATTVGEVSGRMESESDSATLLRSSAMCSASWRMPRRAPRSVSHTTRCSGTQSLLLSAVAMHSMFRRVRPEAGSHVLFSRAPFQPELIRNAGNDADVLLDRFADVVDIHDASVGVPPLTQQRDGHCAIAEISNVFRKQQPRLASRVS